jgi:hypothetical protein
MPEKLTKEMFIERAIKKHGNKIDKANKIILTGYNLISVWEKDYDDFISNRHSPNNYLEIEIRLAKGLKNA